MSSQAVGEFVGAYRVVGQLMRGQSSMVYEVVRRGETKHQALKLLLPEYRNNRQHNAFLKWEYEVGRTLVHERIIQTREYGTYQGGSYIVMELFPWPNMKFFVHRDVSRIAFLIPSILDQAAEGLAHMHKQGWIHCDIKPDNYLMSLDGEVKLIDFALAKKNAGFLERVFKRKSKFLQGTRSYMSPEQIRGKALDFRSDIYGFGCTVHEMLSGKPPFIGTTSDELLMKHLRTAPPPLSMFNKNITPEFEEFVISLLAKEPKKTSRHHGSGTGVDSPAQNLQNASPPPRRR